MADKPKPIQWQIPIRALHVLPAAHSTRAYNEAKFWFQVAVTGALISSAFVIMDTNSRFMFTGDFDAVENLGETVLGYSLIAAVPAILFCRCLFSLFIRHELTFTHEWVRVRRVTPLRTQEWHEPLANYKGVRARINTVRRRTLYVELSHYDPGKALQIQKKWLDSSFGKMQAREEAQAYARLLGVPAIREDGLQVEPPPVPSQYTAQGAASDAPAEPVPFAHNRRLAIAALAAANLAPLWQAFFLGWNVATILMLIWIDILLQAALAFIRLLPHPGRRPWNIGGEMEDASIGKISLIIIWTTFACFVMPVCTIFYRASIPDAELLPIDMFVLPFGLLLGVKKYLPEAWAEMTSQLSWGFWVVVLALMLCHYVAVLGTSPSQRNGDAAKEAGMDLIDQVKWVVATGSYFTLFGLLAIALTVPVPVVLIIFVTLRTAIQVYMHHTR